MNSIATALLHFCEWSNASFWGRAIRDSVWLFPVVEIFHLLALAVLGAIVIMLNARLVGIGFRGERGATLSQEFRPWIFGCVVVMLVSGYLLFSTEAVKMYGNWAFQAKMIFLALALLYTYTIHLRLVARDNLAAGARWAAAVISVLLWTGVGLGGRALGYVTTAATAAN